MTALASPRLLYRALSAEDCTPRYVSWLNDPRVNRFLETRFAPQTLQSVREFVERVGRSGDEHLFGMFSREGGAHIGNIKVGPVRAVHGVAEISLFIGETEYWGRGYAREAIAAVSRHSFERLGVRKLAAGMYAENEASYRAFRRVGYRDEGRRHAHYLLDGKPCDILELGCTAEDLQAA